MADPAVYDLGLADTVVPEALGRPGQRTFKISAITPRGAATIWMEKEQLFQIGLSIKQFSSSRPPAPRTSAFTPEGLPPAKPVEFEFKAGDMSLRHDAASDTFTLSVANYSEDDEIDSEKHRDEPVQVIVSFTRTAADRLAENALEVVAAGRQPCPLCGAPLDGSEHFCVRKNGHHVAN